MREEPHVTFNNLLKICKSARWFLDEKGQIRTTVVVGGAPHVMCLITYAAWQLYGAFYRVEEVTKAAHKIGYAGSLDRLLLIVDNNDDEGDEGAASPNWLLNARKRVLRALDVEPQHAATGE